MSLATTSVFEVIPVTVRANEDINVDIGHFTLVVINPGNPHTKKCFLINSHNSIAIRS